jgi:pimeloyl-ACP methyl ester carboxylesterase
MVRSVGVMTHDIGDPTAISPFRIEIPQSAVDDLHRRLADTRWPDHEPSNAATAGWDRGVPLDYLKGLAQYWRTSYDWRAQEAKLNEFDQFTTEIDGQIIHFLHVRSPEPDALPLLITHGYPSSVVEFADLIGPLTDPRSTGGDPTDAFHVVVPSLPGFGLSTPVHDSGWEMGRTTAAFAELMRRLGYDRYGAHGGDIGAGITGRLAATQPDHVVGTHVISDPGALGLAGEQFPVPDHLTEAERAQVERAREAWVAERGYLELQSHRPQTIGYALTDSPVGQLAWIGEKFQTWTNPAASTPDEAVGRDQLLTNISLYWFTRSGASAAHFLYEAAHSGLDWIAPSGVPAGWAVFNADPLLRRIIDPEHRIEHWSEFAEGGHFAAMEAPEPLVEDLRSFFRKVRA